MFLQSLFCSLKLPEPSLACCLISLLFKSILTELGWCLGRCCLEHSAVVRGLGHLLLIHLEIPVLVRNQALDEAGVAHVFVWLAGWLGGTLPLSCTLPRESMPQTYAAEVCSAWFYREKGLEAPPSKVSCSSNSSRDKTPTARALCPLPDAVT